VSAEGVESVDAYAALWDSINTKAGTRWQDNPAVWVVRFAVVDEVRELYAQWKAQEIARHVMNPNQY